MTEDFKNGYKAALGFIQFRIGMLRLEYPTNIRKRNSLSKAYLHLIDELLEHLKYNENNPDNSSCEE